MNEKDKLIELDKNKKVNYIREMIRLMEKKLEERGIITIKDNCINIVMQLYVKYLKDELIKGDTSVGNYN